MDDLERAIRVIFAQDPSITPSVREEATRYCEGIKARPDCWILCWERLVQTEVLEVKFWCLQVILQALSSISPVARVELRGKVLSWLREVAGKKQEEVVVKNKVALVYAGLIKFDYPAQWPSAWQDLIGLMDLGLPLVDFFLRVLAIFDQEVVNDDVARSNEDRQRGHQIKHAMRERDVVSLVECWYKILTTLKGAAPHMVRDCLKVTALYVVWIEILTVANDKFLSAVCNLIAEASDTAGEACECLAAIVSKKMPASKKVQMLSELQIFARLEACVHRDGSDHQLLVKQADMINSVAEVTLEAYVDLRVQSDADSARLAQVAWESTNALMPLVFWFFAHKEHQVAVCVEPFLTEFFVKVKSFVADGHKGDMEMAPCHSVSLEQVRPILMQTLQLIIQRTSYPPWFQHNDPNFEDEEQHVAFIEFRRSLTKIYKRIFLVDEQLGFQFVQASVAQLTANLSGVQPMEVDAVLYLFKEAGETVRQLEQHLQAKGPLAGCFVQLIECEALVNADHWAVQLALMEVYVKYGKLFALHQELFLFGSLAAHVRKCRLTPASSTVQTGDRIQDASKSLVVKIRNIVGAAHLAPLKTSRGTLWTLLESSKQNDLEIENQAVLLRSLMLTSLQVAFIASQEPVFHFRVAATVSDRSKSEACVQAEPTRTAPTPMQSCRSIDVWRPWQAGWPLGIALGLGLSCRCGLSIGFSLGFSQGSSPSRRTWSLRWETLFDGCVKDPAVIGAISAPWKVTAYVARRVVEFELECQRRRCGVQGISVPGASISLEGGAPTGRL
eukprot:s6460_g2.t1